MAGEKRRYCNGLTVFFVLIVVSVLCASKINDQRRKEIDRYMIDNCNNMLFRKVAEKGFKPSHVAEVGVWHPGTSNIYAYIESGVKSTLVEPDPKSIQLIEDKFGAKENVTLHKMAICDFNGEIELCKRESSTFVSNLPSSPALVNDDCDLETSEKFVAKACLFTDIDDGTIDLISVDTEGSEWYVIKNMVSRPKIISIETHGGMYKNPYLKELTEWMEENQYSIWFKDKSDSVYVQTDTLPITFADKLALVRSEFKIKAKAVKKRLSKRIKRLIKKPGK